MARGRNTIAQRIALDGGKEFEAELKALGAVGEEAFRRLQAAAKNFQGPDNSVVAKLKAIQKELQTTGESFNKIGKQIKDVGSTWSTYITAPLTAAGVGIIKVAGDFESSMNSLQVATQATGDELQKLEEMARRIGKETIFGPQEAAQAMEELAKTGVSTTDILNGAADAAVKLAAANGSELAPAAKLVSDVMNQFHKEAADIPGLVDQITGAVNASKMDFSDYQLAIGQAGAAAGGLGVSFEDLNTALAATSSAFSSGSDAGTSFKTFLQRLAPTTKEAAEIAQQMGLNFFDASGKMKPLAQIAELLRQKFKGLSDEDRNKKLSTFFGTDAMRTAIALMDQGADGIEKVRAAVEKFDADAAAATRMQGFNGQLKQLQGSLEELAIVIGKSGLLEWATKLVKGLADLVDKLAETNPALIKWGSVIAIAAAAIGPLVFSLGLMVQGIGSLLKFGGLVTGMFAKIAQGAGASAGAVSRWALLPKTLLSPWTALAVMLVSQWDDIKKGAQEFYDALFGNVDAVTTPWIRQLSAALLEFRNVWDQFWAGDWSGAWDSLKQGMSDAWGAMLDFAKEHFAELLIIATLSFGRIVAAARAAGVAIAAGLGGGAAAGGAAGAAGRGIFGGLVAAASGAFAAIGRGARLLLRGPLALLLGWPGAFIAAAAVVYEFWPEIQDLAVGASKAIYDAWQETKRAVLEPVRQKSGLATLFDDTLGFADKMRAMKGDANAAGAEIGRSVGAEIGKALSDAQPFDGLTHELDASAEQLIAKSNEAGQQVVETWGQWFQRIGEVFFRAGGGETGPLKPLVDATDKGGKAVAQNTEVMERKVRAALLRLGDMRASLPWLEGLDAIIQRDLDKVAQEARAGAQKVKDAVESTTRTIRIYDGSKGEWKDFQVQAEQAGNAARQALDATAQAGERVIRVWKGVSDETKRAAVEQAKAGKNGEAAAKAAEEAVKKLGAGWTETKVQSEGAFRDLPQEAEAASGKARDAIKRNLSGDDLVEVDLGQGFFQMMSRAEAELQGLKNKIHEIQVEAAKPLAVPALSGGGGTDNLGGGAGGDTLGGPLASVEQSITAAIERLRSLMAEARAAIEQGLNGFAVPAIDWSPLFASVEESIGQIRAAFDGLAQEIPTTLGSVTVDWTILQNGLETAIQGILAAIENVMTAIRGIGSEAQITAGMVASAASSMVQSWNAVAAAAREAAAAQAAAGSAGSGGDGFATGGMVYGPGTATSDSIPAWLSNGEFVQRAKAVRFWGRSFMEAINRLDMKGVRRMLSKGFAKGGYVSVPSFKAGLPAFSGGGLVDGLTSALASMMPQPAGMPRLAAVGGDTSSLRPVNLVIGGESVPMQASEPAIQQLARIAAHKKLTSGGTKPPWMD